MNDRKQQQVILQYYRDKGLIPSLQKVALGAGVSVSTAALFMNGNSQNANIVIFLKRHVKRESVTIPNDLQELFELWDKL